MDFLIEKMKDEDWPTVSAIYEEGIATGNSTFEEKSPQWGKWDKDHLPSCRLVAKTGGEIVGWIALSPVSSRCCYSGVAEVSLYISKSARGKGIGKTLLNAVIKESEKEGIWTLQGQIFPENTASIATAKSCGFREVGFRERIGQMNGIWRNVVLMERRSNVVGI